MSERTNPVFVALDTPELARALELASMLVPHVGGFKVGLEFLTAMGPRGLQRIVDLGLSAPEGRHHLTSLDAADLAALCLQGTARERVVCLAALARDCGLDGVVCSPEEIEAVRETCGKDFLIVTPGVRPEGAARADQRRVSTPAEAVRAGADILVIGRPITAAPDPAEAASAIAAEIGG